MRLYRPFRANVGLAQLLPRAAPWADMLHAFGVKNTKVIACQQHRATSKSASEGLCLVLVPRLRFGLVLESPITNRQAPTLHSCSRIGIDDQAANTVTCTSAWKAESGGAGTLAAARASGSRHGPGELSRTLKSAPNKGLNEMLRNGRGEVAELEGRVARSDT